MKAIKENKWITIATGILVALALIVNFLRTPDSVAKPSVLNIERNNSLSDWEGVEKSETISLFDVIAGHFQVD